MRKKMLIAALVGVVLLCGALLVWKSQSEDYPSEMSIATISGGFSPSGLVRMSNEPFMQFCDFESSREVALCIKPQCAHGDSSCFAFTLADRHMNEGAMLVNLYGGKLYYIKMEYDYLSENKHSIEVYSVNLDGSHERKICTLEGYIFCNEVYIADGVIILDVEKYDPEVHDKTGLNVAKVITTRAIALVDIKSGKNSILPEKSGYAMKHNYVGYGDEVFYYTSSYNVEPHEFDPMSDTVDKYFQEVYDKYRFTVWAVDIKKKTEQPWDDEYDNKKYDELGDFYYFNYADGNMYINKFPSGGIYTIHNYDAATKELKSSKTIDSEIYGSGNFYGSLYIMNTYKPDGTIDERFVYDLDQNSLTQIDSYHEYYLYGYAVPNKLIFSTTDGLFWITTEDLVSGTGEMKEFIRGY